MVKKRLGAEKPMEFARALELGPDGYQKVNRWNHGGRIDYEDAIAMLERCGWLNINTDDQTWRTGQDPLESLAKAVEELVKGQTDILDLLRGQDAVRLKPPASSTKRR